MLNRRGFTLVEMLIVIAIVSVVAFIAVGVAGTTLNKNRLSVETNKLENTLRLAQSRSVSGYQDSVWGVYTTSSSFILFRGSDYATRDSSYDEVHALAPGVIISGISEVVFEIRTGESSQVGTIELTDAESGVSSSISINVNGRITRL